MVENSKEDSGFQDVAITKDSKLSSTNPFSSKGPNKDPMEGLIGSEAKDKSDSNPDKPKNDSTQPKEEKKHEVVATAAKDETDERSSEESQPKSGNSGKGPKKKPTSTALIVDVSNNTTQFWVPDKAVENCGLCRSSFSFIKRRHHCRMCGQIFCAACSSSKMQLPKGYQWGDKKVRVCDRCKSNLQSQKHPQNPEDALLQRLDSAGKDPQTSNADYFKVLGIEPTSDLSVIKKAYMKLAQKLHPDKAKAAGIHYDTSEQFEAVKNAYQYIRKMIESGVDGTKLTKKAARKDGTVKAGQKLDRDDAGKVIHASACSCCHRMFNMIRRRHTCRMCGSVVCHACSPSKRAVEGFATPERVCNNCVSVNDKQVSRVGNQLLITDSVAELKGHNYLRQLKFEAHVEPADEGGFTTVFSFAPEAAVIDDFKLRNLRAHGIKEHRSLKDYQWLREQMLFRLKPRHKIVPPLLPLKKKKPNHEQLQTFLNVILKHVLLHDDPIFQLFITMKQKDLENLQLEPGLLKDVTAWQRSPGLQLQVQVMNLFDTDGESWYRFKIEQHCRERISQEQESREKRQKGRLAEHTQRIKTHAIRAEALQNRMDAMVQRKKQHKSRMESRAKRIEKEQENKDKQRRSDKLIHIEREEDDKLRHAVKKEVKEQREQYDQCVKDHAKAVEDQKRHLDKLVSVQTEWAIDKQEYPNPVHKWLLEHMQVEFPPVSPTSQQNLPDLVRKVMIMRDEIPEASNREVKRLDDLKSKYDTESDLVVDEKTSLAEEEEPIEVEKKNWAVEYKQIDDEKALIDAERANRKKKEEVVEADVSQQEHMIEMREKAQEQRAQEQSDRHDNQKARKRKQETEIVAEEKRMKEQKEWEAKLNEYIKMENDRLKRQRTETHVLRFDHSQTETLLANIRQGIKAHLKCLEDCKALTMEHLQINTANLRKGKGERTESEADVQRMKEGQGRRTIHEFEDGGRYDERDAFAVEINKRRMRNETCLDNEEKRLSEERKRLDEENKRILDEERTLKDLKELNTEEEVQIVALQDLVERLAASVREDETSRASKMKEYLDFANSLVGRQTERLMRYKDIQKIQNARTSACGERLEVSKSSMTKLINLDEASNRRQESAEKRSDVFERQRADQTRSEPRLFFDNEKTIAERELEVKAASTDRETVEQINKFVLSLRPAMNLGMKEKSEQVRILQETWKATKLDHNLLNNFTKKYSKEDISLSGMDNIPDHDNDFAHTLRVPYELAFKQDEQESKAYFHPISAALLKEGDTFAMLRSSQDDLTVWIQKLRDSLRDEEKIRKEEEQHLQAQIRRRSEKERKISVKNADMARTAEGVATEYSALQSTLKNFEKSMEGGDGDKGFDAEKSKIKETESQVERIKKSAASCLSDVQQLEESSPPDEKMVKATADDMSSLHSLYSKYSQASSSKKASLAIVSENRVKVDEKQQAAVKRLKSTLAELKHELNVTLANDQKPNPKDEWMITQKKNCADLKQRVSNYIGKVADLSSEAKATFSKFGKWKAATESLIEDMERLAEQCKNAVSNVEEVKSFLAKKQEAHSAWKGVHEGKVKKVKLQLSSSLAKVKQTAENAQRIKDKGSAAAKQFESLQTTGKDILKKIEDSKGLQSSGDVSEQLSQAEDTLDSVRVLNVQFKKLISTIGEAEAEAKRNTELVSTVKMELKEKEALSNLIVDLDTVPAHSYWNNELDSLKTQARAGIEKIDLISPSALDDALRKFEAQIESGKKLVDTVKTKYDSFKTEMGSKVESLKARQAD